MGQDAGPGIVRSSFAQETQKGFVENCFSGM